MNSNMGLFDEDRDLFADDMGWNFDSMFSAENPLESDFDFSSTAQDFLQSGSAFLDSSDVLFNSTGMLQNSPNHISPRGIAEIAEQESSLVAAKESVVQRETNPKGNSETAPLAERNRQQHATDRGEEIFIRTSQPNCFAFHEREALEGHQLESDSQQKYDGNETAFDSRPSDITETAFRPEVAVGEEPQANGSEGMHAPEFQSPDSQLIQAPHQAQIQNGGDNPETSLHAGVQLQISVDTHEIPERNYQTNNIAGDAIESLVQLPDHVRFTGDFGALLPMQSLSTPADDTATQEPLHFQVQVPHQQLLTLNHIVAHPEVQKNSAPPASHIDLESAMAAANFDHSSLHSLGAECGAPETISAVPNAFQFVQTTTGFPLQNQISSSPGLHLSTQAVQEVFHSYQPNIHPSLQSAVMPDQQALTQGLASSDFRVASQGLPQQDFTTSAGLDRTLSVRPTEGITRKRGRKKAPRDPRKLSQARRKKSNTEIEPVEDNASSFLVDITGSGSLQRQCPQVSAAIPSTAGFEAGSPSHYRAQPPTTPSVSRARGASASCVDDIQPSLPQNSENPQPVPTKRAKGAAPSSSKNPQGVEHGRVAKKPGKKGGRVNPETAHLSVEERRSLRAKRNRESAEKSRVRRKIQTAELETSVAELRDENKSLKTEMLRFQSQLSAMSMEVTRDANTPAEQERLLREEAPALLQALLVVQRAINDCPRTFQPQPHSPEIQLKVRR